MNMPEIEIEQPSVTTISDLEEGTGAIDRDGDFIIRTNTGVVAFQRRQNDTIRHYIDGGAYMDSMIKRTVKYKIVEI